MLDSQRSRSVKLWTCIMTVLALLNVTVILGFMDEWDKKEEEMKIASNRLRSIWDGFLESKETISKLHSPPRISDIIPMVKTYIEKTTFDITTGFNESPNFNKQVELGKLAGAVKHRFEAFPESYIQFDVGYSISTDPAGKPVIDIEKEGEIPSKEFIYSMFLASAMEKSEATKYHSLQNICKTAVSIYGLALFKSFNVPLEQSNFVDERAQILEQDFEGLVKKWRGVAVTLLGIYKTVVDEEFPSQKLIFIPVLMEAVVAITTHGNQILKDVENQRDSIIKIRIIKEHLDVVNTLLDLLDTIRADIDIKDEDKSKDLLQVVYSLIGIRFKHRVTIKMNPEHREIMTTAAALACAVRLVGLEYVEFGTDMWHNHSVKWFGKDIIEIQRGTLNLGMYSDSDRLNWFESWIEKRKKASLEYIDARSRMIEILGRDYSQDEFISPVWANMFGIHPDDLSILHIDPILLISDIKGCSKGLLERRLLISFLKRGDSSLCPKSLEEKVRIFRRRLQNDAIWRQKQRPPIQTIQLSVQKESLFEDSFEELKGISGPMLRYVKLKISLQGKEGQVVSKSRRQWYSLLSREICKPDSKLFRSFDGGNTYQPKFLTQNRGYREYFRFVGRIVAKAVYDGIPLDCRFTRSFYKHILEKPVNILGDFQAMMKPSDYQKMKKMMKDVDDQGLTFSIKIEEDGKTEILDLIDDGRATPVDDANKDEYLRLLAEMYVAEGIENQTKWFLQGFCEVIPKHLLSHFDEKELGHLVSGIPEIDVNDWKKNTMYLDGYTSSSRQILWFWKVVHDLDLEYQSILLRFMTGSSRLPAGGFKYLQGDNGAQKCQIRRVRRGSERTLPTADISLNQLNLPEYKTEEELETKLVAAIECARYLECEYSSSWCSEELYEVSTVSSGDRIQLSGRDYSSSRTPTDAASTTSSWDQIPLPERGYAIPKTSSRSSISTASSNNTPRGTRSRIYVRTVDDMLQNMPGTSRDLE